MDIQDNVILKQDSRFQEPELFHFEQLRTLGLTHLGELSGKLWTDHNLHDPGITTLEALSYALMDLGFRLRLPIDQLLAKEDESKPEDQFFSPAQILSNNPVSILDYRRLLLDIPEVQNAWLHPKYNVEVEEGEPIPRGVYEISVELIPTLMEKIPANVQKEGLLTEHELVIPVLERVRQVLHEHRNLCEDFQDEINVLKTQYLGFDGTIEIEADTDPIAINAQVNAAIRDFLRPSPTFYTLDELLEKGRTIEEAFAGRPYLAESFGFVDPYELQTLELPQEIRLSDIYRILLAIPGVISVDELYMYVVKSDPEGDSDSPVDQDNSTLNWVLALEAGCLPDFARAESTFVLVQDNRRFEPNFIEVETFARRSGLNPKKTRLNPGDLDMGIPKGRYRVDLGDYPSIQNDFPVVYGIGDEGVAGSAPEARKAQALQFKAYLLFFDRLLADYLTQLTHVRDLFSFTPDSTRPDAANRTLFTRTLDHIPDGDKLNRFTYTETELDWELDQVIAQPVSKSALLKVLDGDHPLELPPPLQFSDIQLRDITIQTIQREINQKQVDIQVFEPNPGEPGYQFAIVLLQSQVSLLGAGLYADAKEAHNAAETLAFWGGFDAFVRSTTQARLFEGKEDATLNPDELLQYSFELVWKEVEEITFLNQLIEKPEAYQSRRNEFLDHLLARFGEQFTRYAALMYQIHEQEGDTSQALIETKAQYLSTYDQLSRNRGKAFNLQQKPSFGNEAGLTAKLSGMLGATLGADGHLCPFRVVTLPEEFFLQLTDAFGADWLDLPETFSSPRIAYQALVRIIRSVGMPNRWKSQQKADGLYDLSLTYEYGQVPYGQNPVSEADTNHIPLLHGRLFGGRMQEDQIFVAEYNYYLRMFDFEEDAYWESKAFTSESSAGDGLVAFATDLANQSYMKGGRAYPTPAYHPVVKVLAGEERRGYDHQAITQAFSVEIAGCKWIWQDHGENPLMCGNTLYATEEEATEAFLQLYLGEQSWKLATPNGGTPPYVLQMVNDAGEVIAEQTFRYKKEWQAAQDFIAPFQSGTQYPIIVPKPSGYRWELLDDQEQVQLVCPWLFDEAEIAEVFVEFLAKQPKDSSQFRIVGMPDGTQRLGFYSTGNKLLLYTPQPVPDTGNTGLIQHLIKQLQALEPLIPVKDHRSLLQVRLDYVEEVFGFQVWDTLDKKKTPLLLFESRHVYPTRAAAFYAWAALDEYAKDPQRFYLSGDEGNRQYLFFLDDPDGEFVATHPFTYKTPQERDEVVKRTQHFYDNFAPPVDLRIQYQFELETSTPGLGLRSLRYYDSKEEAEEAYVLLIPALFDEDTIKTAPTATKDGFEWGVENEQGEPIARSLEQYAQEKVALDACKAFHTWLGNFVYEWDIISVAKSYGYYVNGLQLEHMEDRILKSVSTSPSIDAVIDAYQHFIQTGHSWNWIAKEEGDGDAYYEVESGGKLAQVLRSPTYTSTQERDAILAPIKQIMAWKASLKEISQPTGDGADQPQWRSYQEMPPELQELIKIVPRGEEEEEAGVGDIAEELVHEVVKRSADGSLQVLVRGVKYFEANEDDKAWGDWDNLAYDLSVAHLAHAAVDPKAYFTYETSYGYALSIVGDQFQLAVHPSAYNTPSERDYLLNWSLAHTTLPPVGDLSQESLAQIHQVGNQAFHFVVFADIASDEAGRLIIWRSPEPLQTEAEAKTAYETFRSGFLAWQQSTEPEEDPIRRQQTGDCGPFTFAWVVPEREISRTPEYFDTFQAVEERKLLVAQAINVDGVHLIEHLLLKTRPPQEAGWHESLVPNAETYIKDSSLQNDPALILDIEEFLFEEAIAVGYTEKQVNDWLQYKRKLADPASATPDESDPGKEIYNAIQETYPALNQGYQLLADGYSFWVTAVMPSWSHNAMDANYRAFVERTLREEAPGHIAFQPLWLSPKVFCCFEQGYLNWRFEMAKEAEGMAYQVQKDQFLDCKSIAYASSYTKKEMATVGVDMPDPPAPDWEDMFPANPDQKEGALSTPIQIELAEASTPEPPIAQMETTGSVVDQEIVLPEDEVTDPSPVIHLAEASEATESIVSLEEPPLDKPKEEKDELVSTTEQVATEELNAAIEEVPLDQVAPPLEAEKLEQIPDPMVAEAITSQEVEPPQAAEGGLESDPPVGTEPAENEPPVVEQEAGDQAEKETLDISAQVEEQAPNADEPEPTESALTERQKSQLIRKRLTNYPLLYEKVGDVKFHERETYKRGGLFLQSPGALPDWLAYVKYVIRYALGKSGGTSDDDYYQLLVITGHYSLDKFALEPNQAQTLTEALTPIRAFFEEKKVDLSTILTSWDIAGLELVLDPNTYQAVSNEVLA